MLQLNLPSSPSTLALRNPRVCSLGSLSSLDNLLCPHSSYFSAAKSRNNKLSLNCRHSDYFEQQKFSSTPPNDSSFARHSPGGGGGGGGALPPRVYVGHSIYKGKAALTVEPKAPEFTSLDSGALKLSKEGYALLQFAPASGVRQYDWGRKQVFSLSVTEIGTLISLGPKESCEFFHDPFKGKSEEGQVRKVLKVEPLPDGSGHFFNLIHLAIPSRLACLRQFNKAR
ncbi:single-stranded DNA-binding protein WHY1, chloroplastic-like isoform X2 [Malania oleifera]|uniref:single-stranded DNA-binding protein WHY1, chloroplastic-like isoform X2 n=1 Tax=Malania oleifera TaxID=397392 RepID=UPI0025AE7AB5|nr:single-stranded DNA-binding protein WHY1, chloroplastic-like isoform X2 [Malania oleifera]